MFRTTGPLWTSLVMLQGVNQPETLQLQLHGSGFTMLDIKQASETMLRNYRVQALQWFFVGGLMIVMVMYWALKQFKPLLMSLLPLLSSIILTMASLHLLGERLSVFHLVTLLLVVGLSIDYSIFSLNYMNHNDQSDLWVSQVSVVICLISTIIMFGALGLSDLPVLRAIGLTAALGAFYAYLVTRILRPQTRG